MPWDAVQVAKGRMGVERESRKNREQISKELIPFHSNNTPVATTLLVLPEEPYRKEADPVFQKGNNEKIKSCGAFPLPALLINS